MTDITRTTLWAVLSKAFQTVLCKLQSKMPDVQMTAGHSHNDVFPFRAYAEYSKSDRIVVFSLDVQVKESRIHAFGDMALGDGLVIKDLMNVEIGDELCDEGLLITHATDFALGCQQLVSLVASELDQAGEKNHGQAG